MKKDKVQVVAEQTKDAVQEDTGLVVSCELMLFFCGLAFFVGTWFSYVYKTTLSIPSDQLSIDVYFRNPEKVARLFQWSALASLIAQAAFYGVFRYGMCRVNKSFFSDIVHSSHALLSKSAGSIGAPSILIAYLHCAYPDVHKTIMSHVVKYASGNLQFLKQVEQPQIVIEVLLGILPGLILIFSSIFVSAFGALIELLQTLTVVTLLGLSGYKTFTLENGYKDLNQHLFVFIACVVFILRAVTKQVFLRRFFLVISLGGFYLACKKCVV